ncbi:MAG: hypothetical protein DRI84_01525 [Bacteroidetes bacterium]|nr:MAG: hypothetical protein DRI84_01525 [Bacteroidota bacterium]
MKKTLLFLSLMIIGIFCSQNAISQDIKIIEGAEIKSKMGIMKIVGEFDNQLVTVFYGKKKFYLRSYNRKLEVSSMTEIPMTYKKNQMAYATVIKLKNRLFVITIFNNKKSKKTYLLYHEVNPKTLEFNDDIKILGEIPFKSRYDKGDFSIVYSQNHKHILIYHLLPYNKGGKQKMAFSVLDSNLQKVWDKKITLPYADKLFKIVDYEIDDEGNVYVIGKQYKGKAKDIINNQINFNFIILGYFDQGDEEREYQLKEKDKYITDLRLAIDNKLNLICAGFYSGNKSYGAAGGSFLLKIEYESGEMTTSEYHKFDLEFITSLHSERKKAKAQKKASKKKAKGKEVELVNMDLRRLLLRDDGGVIMVGEQNYYTVHTYYNASTKSYTTTYHYYYNNIVIVNYNSDGSIKWKRLVPKRQSQTNSSYYLSFVPAIFQDKVFFVYNDNIKNSTIKKENEYVGYVPNYKKSELVAYRVDGDGETDRIPLFNTLKSKIIPVPRQSRQLDESGALIIFSKSRKIQRLYRIEFSE